ncbi:MAG: flagellar basal body rod protein FlgC [Clostridiaceae bacterium]|nr:flagellar basal body rod protein FlgC [Clostridiaceae bacterium]
MSVFGAIQISASGLTAQSYRMDVIAQNIANAETTRTENGTPYQRRSVVLAEQTGSQTFADVMAREQSAGGVSVVATEADTSPFEMVYNPSHPDADADGYVSMPNVDLTQEYVDLISASRSYEANLTVLNATKQMAMSALELGK